MMECSAEDAARVCEGNAIFASGSPQEDQQFQGRKVPCSQANNMYIFPGLALGAHLLQTGQISDSMIMAAAEAVAQSISSDEVRMSHNGLLFCFAWWADPDSLLIVLPACPSLSLHLPFLNVCLFAFCPSVCLFSPRSRSIDLYWFAASSFWGVFHVTLSCLLPAHACSIFTYRLSSA